MLDIVILSPLWQGEPGSEAIVRRAIAEATAELDLSPSRGELVVALTDDAQVRDLNQRFRGQDQPTNVLAFEPARATGAAALVGDIVIAFETAATEAQAQGKPFAHHVAHLAIHGFLHLAGYDHQAEEAAQTMERLERTILVRLNIPDPYHDPEHTCCRHA